ncbi:MAG: type II secretion system F family protein [Tissierellia bacterium]|nr:type II secretion system F family protein [Tissierellia bacterium]MDD4780362.1 type II secretion system F family protein [Tissierellia bacterium]
MKDFRNKKLSSSELSYFCMQIALILKSGILIHDGIEWMYNDIEEGRIKNVIGSVKKELSNKIPLFEAMKKTECFPSFVVNMCQIGNLTGRLDDVMVSLSEYYDREDYLKLKIKNAILYPAMLFVMMSAIIILLVIKIFPIFENMLNELGGEINTTASMIMSFSTGIFTGRLTMILAIIVLVFMMLLIITYKTNRGRDVLYKFFNNFSFIKTILKKVTAYRFSYSMSLLLSSGMTIEKSIDILLEITDNEQLNYIIKNCSNNLKAGDCFSDTLSQLSIFSNMHIQMLKLGQRSGELDEVMKKLTIIYEQEVDVAINNAISLVEPMLVGFLSVVIGAILISVMLPLMNIMSSIG